MVKLEDEAANHEGSHGDTLKKSLIAATRGNRDNWLQELIEEHDQYNQSLSSLNDIKDSFGNSLIAIACANGCLATLDFLLDLDDLNINLKNKKGDTPLHIAAGYCRKNVELSKFMVELLIDAGAKVKILNNDNISPIEIVGSEFPSIQQILIQASVIPQFQNSIAEESDKDEGV